MREWFAEYDANNGTDIRFWDHDYNYIGLTNPDGDLVGYDYGYYTGDTSPWGLWRLWAFENASRDSILTNHDVVFFKSCYRAADITSDAMLQEYKDYYLEMRDVFAQHADKQFVCLTIPPRNRLHDGATGSQPERARAFADWLTGPEFLGSYRNVHAFDLFDLLAEPDDGTEHANTLRLEYHRSSNPYSTDSHPSPAANAIVGPILAAFIVQVARPEVHTDVDTPETAGVQLRGAYPNPFNPATSIAFSVDRDQVVDLAIFDLRGHLVRTLSAGEVWSPGEHVVRWQGRNDDGAAVPAGVYFCRLLTAGGVQTAKMVLVE